MRAIWKYALGTANDPAGERREWWMPSPAKPLAVGVQDDVPMVWVAVDTEAATVQRTFQTVPTDASIPAGAEYVGTYQQSDGFVGHVFLLRLS